MKVKIVLKMKKEVKKLKLVINPKKLTKKMTQLNLKVILGKSLKSKVNF